MNIVLKVVAAVLCISSMHTTYPQIQEIVAYKEKGFEPYGGYSAIQLYQKSQLVSSATFQERTDKKYVQFKNSNPTIQSLYFDPEQGPLTVVFCHTGPRDVTGNCSVDVLGDSQSFEVSSIPAGSKIKITWNGDTSYKTGSYTLDIEQPHKKRKRQLKLW